MRFPSLVAAAMAILPSALSTGAFTSKAFLARKSLSEFHATTTITDVATTSIAGMKPGTSGLRKKVEVWEGVDESNKNYVENFIQSLLDTAKESNHGEILGTVIVAGDGRYFNNEAIQIICRVLAGNGVKNIWVPQGGIMSTPAVSAAIRMKEGGAAEGAIILTASHNPGGPGEDFGIKYNERYGQPAGEEFTDALYEKTTQITSFKTVEGTEDVDLNADVNTSFPLTPDSTVTIIDPFTEYVSVLKSCFDFEAIRSFAKREDFSILFDGMHGAGGPFAKRVLVEELGFPEVSVTYEKLPSCNIFFVLRKSVVVLDEM